MPWLLLADVSAEDQSDLSTHPLPPCRTPGLQTSLCRCSSRCPDRTSAGTPETLWAHTHQTNTAALLRSIIDLIIKLTLQHRHPDTNQHTVVTFSLSLSNSFVMLDLWSLVLVIFIWIFLLSSGSTFALELWMNWFKWSRAHFRVYHVKCKKKTHYMCAQWREKWWTDGVYRSILWCILSSIYEMTYINHSLTWSTEK